MYIIICVRTDDTGKRIFLTVAGPSARRDEDDNDDDKFVCAMAHNTEVIVSVGHRLSQ